MDRDLRKIPGEAFLYFKNPSKVDYYDLFYFETRMRAMVGEFMEPWRKAMLEDKEKAAKLRLDYN